MSTNFPTALDVLTNPTPTDYLNSPSHAGQHANANDAIEAIQTFIGVNGSGINDRDEKTTPADADEIGLIDSAASYVLKKLTWANLKATLKTYFDTLYTKATGAEITTGTEDGKFVTPKALADATVGKLGAEWSSWTPTWTNLDFGGGWQLARYVQIGKTVHFYVVLTLGSGSSVGTTPIFTLPTSMRMTTANTDPFLSTCFFRDTSATASYVGFLRVADSNKVFLSRISSAEGQIASVSATAPFTWAGTDIISIQGTYEAA